MLKRLIHWAIHSRLVVILLALGLIAFGVRSFLRINVEAYPDPAPAVVEVVAQYPGASAEDVERQVTQVLEVALAGMPGLNYTRSQSMFALSHLRNQFEYGVDQQVARQEVINRLQFVQLPTGVVPQISPQSPTGEIMRYVLRNPVDSSGKGIYTLNDLKSLQDYTLEHLFRRVPRIADITSSGGSIKRYEIRPDPARMLRYGITLQQLEAAIASSNMNVGGQYLTQGETVQVVRSVGLIGDGQDPIERAVTLKDPIAARDYLRAAEARRLREIRQIVLSATNNVPIRVDDIVEGGLLKAADDPAAFGVVVGNQTRLGRVMIGEPRIDSNGQEIVDKSRNRKWNDDDDVVQGVVLLRKGEQSLPALRDVEALVKDLNETPGRLLPGVKIDVGYDRTDLIHVTTSTVQENLMAGMALVTLVLLMFLSNMRTALIVAINVPLALLIAFGLLFMRGKSANLLSIGAVDFGIIADSSVIVVENIYRHLISGVNSQMPIGQRVIHAANEVQRSLLFSTAIMVCAFLPLFTMSGPEGQIFGPMADTYAFALGGAMLLAVTLSPVLCSLILRNLKPKPENFLLRWLRESYVQQLKRCLHYRWTTLLVFGGVVAATAAVVPFLGREFMPELEEGNLWVRATFPLNISLEKAAERVHIAIDIMKKYPELKLVHSQIGRPDDGTDPTGFYNAEFFLPLKPHEQWPVSPGRSRARTKDELVEEMDRELTGSLLGVDWNFSQNIRDNVMEVLSGVKGENSVKIIGPDLAELEKTAERVAEALRGVDGMKDVGVFRILGQSNLALRPDAQLCSRWNVALADVQDVINTSVGGKGFTQMIEGERSFDITVRWPERLRCDIDKILDIPVEVSKHNVAASTAPGLPGTWLSGPSSGVSSLGTAANMPSLTGNAYNATMNNLSATPRYRLRNFVRPVEAEGSTRGEGSYVQSGVSDIYREQGNRLIAVKFDVRGRDLASAVALAKKNAEPLVKAPYRMEWGGEFQEMEQAEERMTFIIPLAIGMVVVLIYLAFRSLVDVLLVLSNVLALCCGGVWALLLTHTNFSISAAVGFISIFGVAITNGLLSVSAFHRLRLSGKSTEDAILEGASNRLRPMMMTAMTATFGLLPAAVSTRIGAQSQQPLAIVVIGGMLMALLLNRYLTPVLYSIFRQEMPDADSARLAE